MRDWTRNPKAIYRGKKVDSRPVEGELGAVSGVCGYLGVYGVWSRLAPPPSPDGD